MEMGACPGACDPKEQQRSFVFRVRSKPEFLHNGPGPSQAGYACTCTHTQIYKNSCTYGELPCGGAVSVSHVWGRKTAKKDV